MDRLLVIEPAGAQLDAMVARAAAQPMRYVSYDGPYHHCRRRVVFRWTVASDSDLCLGTAPVSAHETDGMVC